MKGKLLLLGTGASSGIPMIGCHCPVCSSNDPFNKRLRPSALFEIKGKKVLIDAGPDFRLQALKFGIDHLDGVILTHSHYDHIAGLDELRVFYLINKSKLPVLLSPSTFEEIKKRCHYLFLDKSKKRSLSAQLSFQVIENERGTTSFLTIPIRYFTYEQGGMPVNGYRIGDMAYVSDIKYFPHTIFEDLEGLKTLIISALHSKPSPVHLSIEEAIQFARRLNVERTFFTHMDHALDHQKTNAALPKGFLLAHDGLALDLNVSDLVHD